jgi:hypothetical protein
MEVRRRVPARLDQRHAHGELTMFGANAGAKLISVSETARRAFII